ncbi:c-type cytochrome domain-containing protein [Novipirellula herctigrandis]|uniref:c-type cytochrome domain-containing protein n=1 Tax=Novipirellula herctigrandis TaxID=2527986 RepID=UPI003AF40052
MNVLCRCPSLYVARFVSLLVAVSFVWPVRGQETPSQVAVVDEEGHLIQFQRDIAPILSRHCLECHGPEDAKNDFRVDDAETFMQYVEPDDIEGSTLYIDYLTTSDEDMMMPPTSHGGPLSPSDLALVRTWVDEGAQWPEGAKVGSTDAVVVPAVVAAEPRDLAQRIWAFQGFLHPATVHFPIALLLLGALFVVLGIKWPSLSTQVPLACLILGGISAVVATAMGWSFATEQGYGSWSRIDFDSEVFWHRWSGVLVAFGSVVLIGIAAMAFWRDSERLGHVWKVGMVVMAGMVGAVGHQGGELNYGKDFYPKAIAILLGTESTEAEAEPVPPVAISEQPIDNQAAE